ncbi:restriction endonuclease subunit S [Campylobacter devanensis]|uniref:restriction endonuclease subunit S n=1 Tax=Campylobacter devanensis TaxID=3161138 RepID=UPI000A342F2B|nr:restriction endonuclease subunit S [Campylobacter sp. P0023]
MSKLEELINKLCPNGVEFKTIGELFDVRNGYTPSKNNDEYWENGDISWYRMEDIRANGKILNDSIQHITKKAVKNKLFPKNSLMVATTATIGIHALIKNDFVCNQQLTCVSIKEKNKEKLNIKFCFYYFDIIDEECVRIANQGGGMPIVSLEKMKKLRFPVPPLEVQCEIVRILDNFTLLSAELSAELSARQKQYDYYRDELLTFNKKDENVKWEELGKYCQRLKGTTITARRMKEINKENGKIRIFAGGKTMINTTEHNIPSSDIIRIPNIIVQSRGIIDFIYYEKPCSFKREMWSYTHTNSVTLKFIYYYLKKNIEYFKQRGNQMGSMPQISLEVTEKFKIPLPSMNKQERIVNILDRFDKLCNDISEGLPAEIEARKKQYEYYRDKLLTFKELK